MTRFTVAAALAAGLACSQAARPKEAVGFSSVSAGPVWDDPRRCQEAVRAGRTLPRAGGRVRVGTWNIKWFPDGKPGKNEPEGGGTDLAWLACAITYLDVDVLGLQEVKLTERGRAAQVTLAAELEKLTGTRWSFEVDACADPYRQHVALLYRTDRLQISHPATHGEIDPTTAKGSDKDPLCPGNLRPALGLYVKSKQGGLDFHFVTTHLDSGEGKRDYGHRAAAWQLLGAVRERRVQLVADDDFVVAADLNSMGCGECGVDSPELERQKLVEAVGALNPPMVVAESSAPCSQYYKGRGALLDHVLYTRGMREADGQKQLVEGVCAKTECARIETEQTPVFVKLSDHCPVVLDLFDRDDDPPVEAAQYSGGP